MLRTSPARLAEALTLVSGSVGPGDGGHPKMRGQDMNTIVEVNFLPRTPPPDLGCRLREATFPARSRSRNLRFQMLVDTTWSTRISALAQQQPLSSGCGMADMCSAR